MKYRGCCCNARLEKEHGNNATVPFDNGPWTFMSFQTLFLPIQSTIPRVTCHIIESIPRHMLKWRQISLRMKPMILNFIG
ncbi:hypothetical protein QL285_094931 [Trifolium repens]|nr:hypothetical protein QL285_094931 [Trifolium repens]